MSFKVKYFGVSVKATRDKIILYNNVGASFHKVPSA